MPANNIKHNLSHTTLYLKFRRIKSRCYSKQNNRFQYYGAKGIKICDEWLNDFSKFYEWAINNGYKEGLSIERKDITKDYCPENCCWIPKGDQNKNTTRNVWLTAFGETKILSDWARDKRCQVSFGNLHKKITRGIPLEKAMINLRPRKNKNEGN